MHLSALPDSWKQQDDSLQKDEEIGREGKPYENIKVPHVTAVLCPQAEKDRRGSLQDTVHQEAEQDQA